MAKVEKIVYPRKDRDCIYCNSVIKAGTSCTYKYKKDIGGLWVCSNCTTLLSEYNKLLEKYSSNKDFKYLNYLYSKLSLYETKLLERGMISEDDCIAVFN